MTCDEVKPLLDAHLDEELEAAERGALDSHLKSCSGCARELDSLKNVRQAVRGAMPYYHPPAHLRDQVRFALRGAAHVDNRASRNLWRPWGAIAAGIGVCALLSAPFVVNSRNQSRLVAEELLSAHERALVGRSVDVVSSDQHTVKPWFNGKLPFSPPVNDLRTEGFPLEGGRVDYAGEHAVAALVYTRRLHRIDVFIRPAEGEKAPPEHFVRNGFTAISWSRDNFLFTAVSDLNSAELTAFTRLLRNQ